MFNVATIFHPFSALCSYFCHTGDMPTHQDVHTSGYCYGVHVQRGITGNTTQYYQNTTKGFEFLDANFKIKAV